MRILAAQTVLFFLVSLGMAETTVLKPEPASALSPPLSVETVGSALLSASSTESGSVTSTEAGEALVTSPPEIGEGGVIELQEKWHLTTYWSCNVFDQTVTMCGWHEPVLPGGTEIARAGPPLNARAAAIVAGVLAAGAAFQ